MLTWVALVSEEFPLSCKGMDGPDALESAAGALAAESSRKVLTRPEVLAAFATDVLEDDPELAAITGFAARMCEAPVALVSLVEDERQRFLAREGFDQRESPRETSFCAHAMLGSAVMEVPDATRDPRFAGNPLVTGEPRIRFYAGAPLVSGEGVPLGALCVISPEPRGGLSDLQREGLTVLAAATMRRLTGHRAQLDADRTLSDTEKRFTTLADAIPVIVWSARPEGGLDYISARWHEFSGSERVPSFHEWDAFLHPDDKSASVDAWAAALTEVGSYESQLRLRGADGKWHWMLSRARPLRDGKGNIIRWIGTMTDIDANRRRAERTELLSRELSHRIKNIFAVIGGLLALKGRNHPEAAGFVADVRRTIEALGRAHDYVRHDGHVAQDSLHALLGEILGPYREPGEERVTVTGADVPITERAATPLALVFHELATNAAKYGALSVSGGRVEVRTSSADGTAAIEWLERDGPKIAEQVITDGFGTRLIEASVTGQLRGAFARDWRRDGLNATLEVPVDAL
jgi:PAS domain S-box-containing protein